MIFICSSPVLGPNVDTPFPALAYEILYCNVFQLKDVRLAVDTMLHDKEYASIRRDSANSAELKEIGALVEKILGTSISRDNSQEEADKG